MRNGILAATAALLIGLTPLVAAAQATSVNQPITGISVTTRGQAEGTVSAIDPGTRTVTVQTADGRTVRGKVSDAAGGLESVKVGDKVMAAYVQKLSYVLSRPDARTPGDRMQSATVMTGGGGALPAGAQSTRALATWTVISVNTANNTISMVDPAGGRVETFDVETAEGRSQLPRVKPGDKLTVSLVENVFAAVLKK